MWNQRGSSVIRGNLIVIPVKGTLLYIEPLYLRSEQSELPELKRVIVAYGNRIVMGTTLDEALRLVTATREEVPLSPVRDEERPTPELSLPTDWQSRVEEVVQLFNQAQDYLAQGNWEAYGQTMSRLQQVINELDNQSK